MLTAAHCVLSEGLYFIKYGADMLGDDTELLPVDATWRNPRYSASQSVNDTGLLLLSNPIPGAVIQALPSVKAINSALLAKGVKLEIVGWGKNQNGEDATYLRKALVDDQTAFARKIKQWAPWRNDVWFAVGKYNSKEKVFTGACNGDSGGPLFALVGGKRTQVGITSWGAENCELGVPSVYVRLSYYIGDIQNGLNQLLVNETKQNRALPSIVTLPIISGTVKAGSSLICNAGTWSSNTISAAVKWVDSYGLVVSTNSQYLLPTNYNSAAAQFTCVSTGMNANGSVEKRVTISIPSAPVPQGSPTVTPFPSTSQYSGNNVISCTPPNFTGATTAVTYSWVVKQYFSQDGGTSVGRNSTFVLTKEFVTQYGKQYLGCVVAGTGDGGTRAVASEYQYISPWAAPSLRVNPVIGGYQSYSSPIAGTVMSCSGWSWNSSVDAESMSWWAGYGTASTKIQEGGTVTLTSDFISKYAGQDIFCIVGAVSGGATSSYYVYTHLSPPFVSQTTTSTGGTSGGQSNTQSSQSTASTSNSPVQGMSPDGVGLKVTSIGAGQGYIVTGTSSGGYYSSYSEGLIYISAVDAAKSRYSVGEKASFSGLVKGWIFGPAQTMTGFPDQHSLELIPSTSTLGLYSPVTSVSYGKYTSTILIPGSGGLMAWVIMDGNSSAMRLSSWVTIP